jgi:hypothetical protein
MSMFQVALVDKTGGINPELIQSVAAALTIQVNRDLAPFWNVQASVTYQPTPTKIPAGVWPVFLVKSLPPGEGGFHLDQHNQPYAEVIASPQSDEWTIDASHETVEMLVDPAGNRLQNSIAIAVEGKQIEDTDGEFAYLVEACDPCEADNFAYSIQGVAVSDFLTPHFYDPTATPGTRYSFTGAITRPRDILAGGYITWVNQETDTVQQLQYLTNQPKILNLGSAAGSGLSLREWVDNYIAGSPDMKNVRAHSHRNSLNKQLLANCKARREHLSNIAERRATLYEPPKRRTAGGHN